MAVCVCNSSTEKLETEESSGLTNWPLLTTWQVLGHWESLSQQQQKKWIIQFWKRTVLRNNTLSEIKPKPLEIIFSPMLWLPVKKFNLDLFIYLFGYVWSFSFHIKIYKYFVVLIFKKCPQNIVFIRICFQSSHKIDFNMSEKCLQWTTWW